MYGSTTQESLLLLQDEALEYLVESDLVELGQNLKSAVQ